MNDLTNVSWSILDTFTNPNDALGIWYKLYHQFIDNHAPYRKRRVKYRKKPEWLDDKIIESMKMRDKYKKQRDAVNYKKLRNLVVKMIREAKTVTIKP